jgi:hypothetical protein
MSGRIDFGASVEPDGCCFCGKPLVNLSEQTENKNSTIQTTEGEALVLHYHEACFQEHVAPASRLPKAQFIR